MSKLIGTYQISIWEDVWDENSQTFKEQFVATIGSDSMPSQNKVLEPSLTKSCNGTKKLSFKLAKQYVDNFSGEKINNPFVNYLNNETKVKLKYKNKKRIYPKDY